MTETEFKLVLGCLHPDRVPDELKPRFDKAFAIFKRLERNANTTKRELRKNGWGGRRHKCAPTPNEVRERTTSYDDLGVRLVEASGGCWRPSSRLSGQTISDVAYFIYDGASRAHALPLR